MVGAHVRSRAGEGSEFDILNIDMTLHDFNKYAVALRNCQKSRGSNCTHEHFGLSPCLCLHSQCHCST